MRTFTTTALLFASITAHAACYDVKGVVTTIPNPDFAQCAAAFSPNRFPHPDQLLPPSSATATCFKVVGNGTATFTGLSALTTVPLVGANQAFTATPLFYVDPVRKGAGLSGFSSQASLAGRLRRPNEAALRGRLFTKDTGVITGTGVVGQVLIVVGGTRDFRGAKGTLAVGGQELGGAAPYNGQVCVP